MRVLFFLYERQYLRQKYRDDRDKAKKDDLPHSREEYRRKSEYRRQREDDRTDLRRGESEFEEAEMQMGRLISLQGILTFEYATRDDIDEVDKVDTDDGHSRRDLPSGDDRECRYEKPEHDRPRISHESRSRYIEACDEVGHRDDDRKYDEEEVTILFCRR